MIQLTINATILALLLPIENVYISIDFKLILPSL